MRGQESQLTAVKDILTKNNREKVTLRGQFFFFFFFFKNEVSGNLNVDKVLSYWEQKIVWVAKKTKLFE